MSISQILQPNNFSLHCKSIEQSSTVITNSTQQYDLLPNTTVTNVMLTTIINSCSKVKIDFIGTLWFDVSAFNIINVKIMNGARVVFLTRVGSVTASSSFRGQYPLTLSFIDEVALGNQTYYLEFEMISSSEPNVINYLGHNNQQSQLVLSEV